MTVGTPAKTGKPQTGLTYQCLSGSGRGPEITDFPTSPCTGGLFTSHHFPAFVPPLSLIPCLILKNVTC